MQTTAGTCTGAALNSAADAVSDDVLVGLRGMHDAPMVGSLPRYLAT